MDKWDTLEDKVTEKKGSSKKVVVLCVALGVVVACGLFFVGMLAVEPVIDEYLSDTKEISNLYDFYDLKVGKNQTAVYFIGSCVVANSIYPPKINQILSKRGYNITAYNLYISNDRPIERSVEIHKIIESSPSLVVFGVTYRSVTDEREWPEERVMLVHDRLDVREDSLYLYSGSELKDLQTGYTLFDLKKFLKNTLSFSVSGEQKALDYQYDPYGLSYRLYLDGMKNPEQIIREADDPNDIWHPIVTNESTRYKEALIYNVETLQNAGIPVVIINMPLHPLTSEKITNESRQNFYDLLNQTGTKWYDMEIGYGDECFRSSHQMLFSGAQQFAPVMADLIISEVKSGAVHYA